MTKNRILRRATVECGDEGGCIGISNIETPCTKSEVMHGGRCFGQIAEYHTRELTCEAENGRMEPCGQQPIELGIGVL